MNRYTRGAKPLCIAMAIVAAVLPGPAGIQVASAAPADIFQSAAPMPGAGAPKATEVKAGDASVATETGAMQFGFPITVPPGRQGAQPSLSLGYSSQGSIYGGLAAGWSLSIPMIAENTTYGRLRTHYGLAEAQQSDPRFDDLFTSSLAGGRILYKVDELAALPANTYGYYRAQNDSSFARYERMNATSTFRWRVLTTDGGTMYFGDNGTDAAGACASILSDGYAPLTKTVDSFGNSVRYKYALDPSSSECRIDSISYGANANAGLADIAKVSFVYNASQSCPVGGTSPIGSQSSYRTGTKIVTGVAGIGKIKAESFPNGLAAAAAHTREITMTYDTPGVFAGNCTLSYAPYRILTSVQESAWGADLAAMPRVDLPAVTMEYGSAYINRTTAISGPPLPGGKRLLNHWPSVDRMLIDVNGDGVMDSVTSTPDLNANGKETVCKATWTSGSGGTGGGVITMPMLPWNFNGAALQFGEPGDCSLNSQRTSLFNNSTTGCDTSLSAADRLGTQLAYRWMDIDNDGMTDIVASIQLDGCYLPEGGTQPLPLGLPTMPSDAQGLYCTSNQAPRCETMYNSCWSFDGGCATNGTLCNPNWTAINQGACVQSQKLDCRLNEYGGQTTTLPAVPPALPLRPIDYPATDNYLVSYGRCGKYPWFVYKNSNGVFPTTPNIKWQPVPLEAEQGDSSIGGGGYSAARKSISDIDGDGNPDSFNIGQSLVAVDYPALPAWWWNTFLGDGTGGFVDSNYLFRAPDGQAISTSEWAYGSITPTNNQSSADLLVTNTLVDINSDGLPDYVTSPKNGTSYNSPINIAFNDGNGFRLLRTTTDPTLHGERQLPSYIYDIGRTRIVNGVYVSGTNKYGYANKPTAPGYYTDGDKVTMERWMDVDADGRVDLVSMGASATGTPTVYYNIGDNLGPGTPMIGAAAVLKAPQRVAVIDSPKQWNTKTDFLDIDGDGITEFYESSPPDYNNSQGFKYDPVGKPPRLLHTIHNGRGADTVITYAQMHDSTTVVQDPANGKATSKSRWVVKSVLNTDALTKTDNAGNASFSATTLYKYFKPRTMPDEGKFDFRGFSEVQVTGPSGAVTTSRYQYDNCGGPTVLCDPTGRLYETVTFHAGGTVANTVNTTSWVDKSVFDSISPSYSGIVSYFPLESKSYICAAGQSETACRGTPAAFSKTVNTYSPLGFSAATNSQYNYLAWVITATTLKSTDSAVPTDGDRTTATTYTYVADTTNWRIRPTAMTKTIRVSGAAQTYAKAETTWDATKRFVDDSRSWIDNDPTRVLVTKFTYDPQTGNQLTVQKPQQVADTSTLKTTRTYDANRLFVISDANEMNIIMDYETEPGTGVTLATKGPNNRACTTCPITATSLARQEHRVKLDGLGRTREIWDTPSDQGYTYDLVLVGRNTYTDSVNLTAAPKVGPRVLSEKLLEGGLTTWTQERTETDAHGRAIIKTTFAQGSAPVDAVSTFYYGNDSTLRLVTLPDPTLNTAAVVTYKYTYDSLGRPLTMRRPDNAVSTSQSGIDIAYNGVTQTTTEVVGAAAGNPAKKITVSDTFGRLSQVQERISLSPEVLATTTYTYAADDTVRTINDPENVLTTLTHDFAGRRTAITRAGKTWTYNYDRNGNLASEVAPGAAPVGDLLRFTNTMTYDAGDRMITKVLGSRGMLPADQTLFGTGSMTFLWDYGPNRAGRLRYARSFAPSVNTATATPILLEEYQYNERGNVTFMYHTFNSAGYTNLTRSFGRSYQPWGGVLQTYYRDYVGGTNETQSTVRYDARAMPSVVSLARTGETTQYVASQTRNVAGLVTKRRTDQLAATGAMPWIESNWIYDSLGRVTSQTVQKSANTGGATEQVAKQTLAYAGNDDPTSLVHVLGLAGATANTKTYGFTYDHRHQLLTATATQSGSGTGQRLNQTFAFGAGGRFTRATVNSLIAAVAGTGSDIKRRDVDYIYGNADKEQVTQLKRSGTTTAYANYAYDDAGNQTQRSYPAGTLTASPSESGNAETFDYLYDGDDRLRRVTKRVSAVVTGSEEYWYDNGGQRIAVLKRNATGVVQELRWFIGDTQAHYDAAGVVTKTYAHVALGTPVARVERTANATTAIEYQFHGLASNMISAVSSAGVVNVNVAYAPYGETVESQQPAGAAGTAVGMPAHRRRMNDKYVDEIGSLAYYGARYYDNVLIGWTQGDPLFRLMPDAAWIEPRRANLYQFTASNPNSYIDPDGKDIVVVGQNTDKIGEIVVTMKEIVKDEATVTTSNTKEGDTQVSVTQTPAQAKGPTSDSTKQMLAASSSSTKLIVIQNINSKLAASDGEKKNDIAVDKKFNVTDGKGGAATLQPKGKKEVTINGKSRSLTAQVLINQPGLVKEVAGHLSDTVPLTKAGALYHEIIGHGISGGDEPAAVREENKWRANDPNTRGGSRKAGRYH
jgi:RHS repeat-associated protein